jgi:Protein of unknown function (DUF2934)
LCNAPFYVIRPHVLKLNAMRTVMTIANNVIAGRDQLIADMAFRLWEEEGRPEGQAEAHWLRAAVLVDEAAPKMKAKKPNVKPVTVKKQKKT